MKSGDGCSHSWRYCLLVHIVDNSASICRCFSDCSLSVQTANVLDFEKSHWREAGCRILVRSRSSFLALMALRSVQHLLPRSLIPFLPTECLRHSVQRICRRNENIVNDEADGTESSTILTPCDRDLLSSFPVRMLSGSSTCIAVMCWRSIQETA